MSAKIAITFFILLPALLCAQDTSIVWCHGPIVVVPADSESTREGYPMVRLDEPRDGVYNLRFYRPVKIVSAKALDANIDGCGSMALWYRSGCWCEPQYFWREPCDASWSRALHMINNVVAQGTEFAGRDFDVYSEVHVKTLTDTLWSVEVVRYQIPFTARYREQVAKNELKRRLLMNELDTSRHAAQEILAFVMPSYVERFEPRMEGFDVNYSYAAYKPFGDLFQTYPLTFDPRTLALIEPEMLLGDHARERIYREVLAYSEKHPDVRINTYHYQPELRRMILLTVKEDQCYIHVGEEGEFRGKHRIRIPLTE